MTGAEVLRLRLFQLIRIEAHSATFIEYLIDLTSASGPLQVVNDHVSLVSQEALSSLGLRWSCHSFSQIGATTVVPCGKFSSYIDNNHS